MCFRVSDHLSISLSFNSHPLALHFFFFSGANTDFDKLTGLGLSYYGEQYDYFSLMHYESNEGGEYGLFLIIDFTLRISKWSKYNRSY